MQEMSGNCIECFRKGQNRFNTTLGTLNRVIIKQNTTNIFKKSVMKVFEQFKQQVHSDSQQI